ncbi:MAG: putative molybdenum carrier protein [Pirellulales bacterium]
MSGSRRPEEMAAKTREASDRSFELASDETHSNLSFPAIERIVSGGQTGVDRGALEAAIQLDLEHGGWCPRGRRAEDGRIPDRYDLRETESARYDIRTEYNVVESDATLIIHRGPLTSGTALTRRLAQRRGKPFLLIDLARPVNVGLIRDWLARNNVKTLNVAGPRESSAPGIEHDTIRLLVALLTRSRH